MQNCRWNFAVIVSVATLVSAGGCGTAAKPPAVDPAAAAAAALAAFDKDNDGVLSEVELAACPSLLASVAAYDTSGDRQLDSAEITARLTTIYKRGVGLTTRTCRILLGRRPLSGARVRFVPAPFLGEHVMPAEGTTDAQGYAAIAVPSEKLPEAQRSIAAVQIGLYRVEVTHPSVKIPPKYNTQTTLGYEVAPGGNDPTPTFQLDSR